MSADSECEETWSVELLADVEDDARVLELRADPAVVVVDRLAGQRAGLRRLRSDSVDAGPFDEASRWVYYPWRRTLVRILGPVGFRRLRYDRNRNKITSEEQERLSLLTIGVVGLSVGQSVAYVLALEGACGTLRLADHDHIELSNLNRIPVSVLDLGLNKATVAARRIAELDPYLPVEVWCEGVVPEKVEQFVSGLDVVIDECDSLDIKLQLRTEAARCGIPVLMSTSDRGLLDIERFDRNPGRPPFHGLLGDLDPEILEGMSNRDKVPYMLRMLGAEDLSARAAASLIEVSETLETWPQLAGDVFLGAATVVAAIRRIAVGAPLRSGRCRIDIDVQLTEIADVPDEPDERVASSDDQPSGDPVDRILYAASRAPSGGNCQPWRILADSVGVRLELAPGYRPTAMDVRCRASWVALGAAMHNAKVALAAHGMLGAESITAGEDSVVAELTFGEGSDGYLAAQYPHVLARATNRRPTDGTPLSSSEISRLRDAAVPDGGSIRVVTDPVDLASVAEALAESDRIRYLTPTLRQQMSAELRREGCIDVADGIGVASLGLDSTDLAMLDIVLRDDVLDQLACWDSGRALGKITRDRTIGSGGLVAIEVSGPDPIDYLHAGRVVQSVWVCAQELGLAAHPMSPVFLYAEGHEDLVRLAPRHAEVLVRLRDDLAGALGGEGRYALLLRVGRSEPETVRSGRRKDRLVRLP